MGQVFSILIAVPAQTEGTQQPTWSYTLHFPCGTSSVELAHAALLKRLPKHMKINPKYCLTNL